MTTFKPMRTRPKKIKSTQNAFNFRMPNSLRARVDKLAERHGLKPADLVRNALWTTLPEWESKGITIKPVAA